MSCAITFNAKKDYMTVVRRTTLSTSLSHVTTTYIHVLFLGQSSFLFLRHISIVPKMPIQTTIKARVITAPKTCNP